MKTLDVSGSFVSDFHITLVGTFLVISCVWVLLKQLDYTQAMDTNLRNTTQKRKKKKLEKLIADEQGPDYQNIIDKMRPIILGAANSAWTRLIYKNETTLNAIGCANVITTEQAKQFLAHR